MFMVDICRYDISIYLYSCSEADRPTEGNWAPLVARSHEGLCLCKININQPHDGYNLVIWSIRIIDYRLYNQHMMYGIYIAYIYMAYYASVSISWGLKKRPISWGHFVKALRGIVPCVFVSPARWWWFLYVNVHQPSIDGLSYMSYMYPIEG
jgi:hypothetical protein